MRKILLGIIPVILLLSLGLTSSIPIADATHLPKWVNMKTEQFSFNRCEQIVFIVEVIRWSPTDTVYLKAVPQNEGGMGTPSRHMPNITQSPVIIENLKAPENGGDILIITVPQKEFKANYFHDGQLWKVTAYLNGAEYDESQPDHFRDSVEFNLRTEGQYC